MLPADRFFARLEKFQCACPSCGRLLTSHQDQGNLSQHLLAAGQALPSAKYRKRMRTVKSIQYLTWNPFTQRLTCPWCNRAFVAGLILYPVKPGGLRPQDPPPDVEPTIRERQELARRDRMEQSRLAGGYYADHVWAPGEPVNVHVDQPCSCPPRGWASDCPVHGSSQEPVEGGP